MNHQEVPKKDHFLNPLCYLKKQYSEIFLTVQLVNNLSAIQDTGDVGSIPGSGRPLGEGNGNPLQYFCLEGYSPWARKSRTCLSEQTTATGRLPHLQRLMKSVS